MIPRFRFAPSPTGIPHIGNLHTALFSWALSRALRGDFILRIEDSDPARNTPQALQEMLSALTWLGIDWDEGPDSGGDFGPYVQSQRLSFHQAAIAQLLSNGRAYYGDDPLRKLPTTGNPLRLRMPKEGQTVVNDALRGEIVFDNARLADPVLVRSDGRPLYHLAAMVDDHDMGITHVVRGEEWIPSAPIHVQLYKALGWSEPVWVHLPLILNKHGQKLKKRDPEGGYLITDFQDAGYLPQAVFNYLLLLGWAPDDAQEIISKWDVRQQFRIERLSPTASIFDWDKLNWVNRQYMGRLSDEALAELLRSILEDAYGSLPPSDKWLVRVTAVTRNSLNKAADIVEQSAWAFEDEFNYSNVAQMALSQPHTREVLTRLVAEIAAVVVLDVHTANAIIQALRQRYHENHGLSARQLLHPIRAALTGDTKGPPLPDIMSILGKYRSLKRLGNALRSIFENA